MYVYILVGAALGPVFGLLMRHVHSVWIAIAIGAAVGFVLGAAKKRFKKHNA
ncbi:MAG TPA: hypothetical protein VGF77_10815 [Allosphingosinicella sp.]|jgi:small basic protein